MSSDSLESASGGTIDGRGRKDDADEEEADDEDDEDANGDDKNRGVSEPPLREVVSDCCN
jgi:hypothetical protein